MKARASSLALPMGVIQNPASREVFTFHRLETHKEWLEQGGSLRQRLTEFPLLNPEKHPAVDLGLRDCQELAIGNLEASFKHKNLVP